MDYRASLDYLYGLQLFGIKLGLANITTLLERLGNPQDGLRCIHVAGTNGKGSVSLLLSEMLGHAGYRAGLYTSPHLQSFTERIRIAGDDITAAEVATLTGEVRAASEGLPITFFEATTALALLAFRAREIDVAVIETGMGGRLDATNVVRPLLCCITPVSLDHQEYLGATLEAIAAEKAGIIKPGVPVVAGRQTEAVAGVLRSAAESCQAPLWLAGRDYSWRAAVNGMNFTAPGLELAGLTCRLPGTHQCDNYAQALAAAVVLRGLGVAMPDEAMRAAGRSAFWPARLEWWGTSGILLDGAHNRAGAECLADYLSAQGFERVHLVCGLTGQRTPDEVLAPLRDRVATLHAVPVPDATVTVAPEQLVAWAAASGAVARSWPTPEAGLGAALDGRRPGEVVVVCGSLYLVAAVRTLLQSGVNPTGLADDHVA